MQCLRQRTHLRHTRQTRAFKPANRSATSARGATTPAAAAACSVLCAPLPAGCGPRPFQAAGAGRCCSSSRSKAVRVMAAAGDKLTIAVTGATGLVGSRLAAKLAAQGNRVRVLTRNVNSAKAKLQYPGLEFYSLAQINQAVKGSDAVVNLAGEPIGTRWTPAIKKQIRQSRIDITSKVASAISSNPEATRPKVFVSSSAVGYYGASATASFTEDSPSGSDYLAQICTGKPEPKPYYGADLPR
eukprot:GHRQ01021595.1.p1 GENE.GHRQ01021595.1~~GHRQ01021595.1.p1  ORF type:complete len:243 (+),score=68.61 GHRQ01021595.1:406-1134(+)